MKGSARSLNFSPKRARRQCIHVACVAISRVRSVGRCSTEPTLRRPRITLLNRISSGSLSLMSDDVFFSLRARAYELAESGRFKDWFKVADALQAEGFVSALIQRLDRDPLAVMMITRCCLQARA